MYLIFTLSLIFNFMILHILFSVNNGIFRQYRSPRDINSLRDFVSKKIWTKVDPIPSWKSPTSFHMSILSQFFKLSQVLRVSIYCNLYTHTECLILIDLFKYLGNN